MYDVVIIGGGIIGSWTGYQLLKHYRHLGIDKVLIVEQFPPGHTRGSSHGHSRNFRMTGHEDMTMIKAARQDWIDLQNETNDTLFITHPRLTMSFDTANFLHKWFVMVVRLYSLFVALPQVSVAKRAQRST